MTEIRNIRVSMVETRLELDQAEGSPNPEVIAEMERRLKAEIERQLLAACGYIPRPGTLSRPKPGHSVFFNPEACS